MNEIEKILIVNTFNYLELVWPHDLKGQTRDFA